MQPQGPHKWMYVLDEPTRILVVDDDPILREFAMVHLATPVAEVEAVADGKAALDLLLTRDFDIALVEIGTALNGIVELADRIADDCGRDSSNSHVMHAKSIAAMAHHALHLVQEDTENGDAASMREQPAKHANELAAGWPPGPQDAASG